MGIHRQRVHMLRILLIIDSELIGIAGRSDQVRNGPAVVATAQSRSSLTRAARNHCGKTLIVCSRPEGCLAQARNSVDGYAVRIDGFVGFEVILHPAHAPRPRCNGAPLVGCGLGLSWLQIARTNPVWESSWIIRLNVAVVERGHAEAGCQ